MLFRNREDAGRQLASELKQYTGRKDVLVLGIPRGGVPVAYEVARAIQAPLDVFISRKLGVPGHEELAFGAIAAGGGRFLDRDVIQAAGISPLQIEYITKEKKKELDARTELYRGKRPPLRTRGRIIILVDDGIATGASIYAAIRALQSMHPAKLIVASPVAPASTCAWLQSVADQLVILHTPKYFYAVGQFYADFTPVSDNELVHLLRRADRDLPSAASRRDEVSIVPHVSANEEISLLVDGSHLKGRLTIPKNAKAIVLFAHGTGSGRNSPRNLFVAEALHASGLGTLLFDLLTPEEEKRDHKGGHLRFDIQLLTKRLVEVTRWVERNRSTADFKIGYFGASTGAAAALVAAARLPDLVSAIVCRGGRPDLAANALGFVHAPTLLLVGEFDPLVVNLNRQALDRLGSDTQRLIVVPGASHLFEEPGTLETVAHLAAEWFVRYLIPHQDAKESVTTQGIAAVHP